MLDKSEFPRDKPCGGGVNVRSARLLPFDLASVTERTIHSLYVSVHRRPGFERRSPEPLSFLTQRRHFDTLLVQKAVDSGVVLKERSELRGVERDKQGWKVQAGGASYRSDAIVAAD